MLYVCELRAITHATRHSHALPALTNVKTHRFNNIFISFSVLLIMVYVCVCVCVCSVGVCVCVQCVCFSGFVMDGYATRVSRYIFCK